MAINNNNKRQHYDNSWNHIEVYNENMVVHDLSLGSFQE